MRIWENIQIGFTGLLAHKLRALLTMLGIIFGVGAVVAMLSIGEGARLEALKQIELMGMNNIIVQDAELEEEELVEARAGFSQGLTEADASAIEAVIPQVIAAIPLRRDETKVQFGSHSLKVNLIGSTPYYLGAQNLTVVAGRFPNWDDLSGNRKVCAIGNGVKRELFPFSDPLGKDIKINEQWFRIVGVMAAKDVSIRKIGGYQVRDFNQDVIVPLSCSKQYFPRNPMESPLEQIIIKMEGETDIRAVGDVLRRMLFRRHHEQDDFSVIIPEELLRQSQATQRIFNIVMGAIAGISLLVGGIGIMNIMLSSVLERTREIGIRRAVGARKTEIMSQFLIESVVLSFSGGVIGVVLGAALAKVITFYAGWITIVSLYSVFTAFGVASGVGLIFGLYPARRAANLHPIEALRYE